MALAVWASLRQLLTGARPAPAGPVMLCASCGGWPAEPVVSGEQSPTGYWLMTQAVCHRCAPTLGIDLPAAQ